MMRKRNGIVAILLSLALVAFAFGCEGSGSDTDGDVDTDDVVLNDGDDTTDTDDVVVTDGDETDLVEGIETETDTDTTTCTACDPACGEGNYCDKSDCTCKVLTATVCETDANCGTGETCEELQDQDCKLCLASCAGGAACPAGYQCVAAAGNLCFPMTKYIGTDCQVVQPTENRNVACQSDEDCIDDASHCLTVGLTDYPYGWCAASCSSNANCIREAGVLMEDCQSSLGICLAQCTSHDDCPEFVDCINPFGSGSTMWCIHQSLFFENGEAEAGEACNPSSNPCKEGLNCQGTCMYLCNDVHGYYYPVDGCPENSFCITYSNVRFGFCQVAGTELPGHGCGFGSNVNPTKDDCAMVDGRGSACLGIDPSTSEQFDPNDWETCDPANNGHDCDPNGFPGADPACVQVTGQGYFCGTSFCAPMCNDDGDCTDLDETEFTWAPYNLGGDCYCMPGPIGNSQPGEACPFGDMNADADYCASGSGCIGIDPAATSDPCTQDSDCSAANYTTGMDCVDLGNGSSSCGASYCAPYCVDGGCSHVTGTSFTWVAQTIGGSCYCLPLPVGTSEAGDACPFGDMNADADACVAGAGCIGIDPAATNDPCTQDSDCSVANYTTGMDCVDLGTGSSSCGASYCAPYCVDGGCSHVTNTEFTWSPMTISGSCYCLPGPLGDSKAGEACPFGDINADADYCAAGAGCIGIDPSATNDPCTQDTDCSAEDYTTGMDCVDLGTGSSSCGASYCAPYCVDGGCAHVTDTTYAWYPQTISGSCYCLPTLVGAATANQACIFGNFNADTDHCAAGLLCIGLSDDTTTCTEAANCSALGGNFDCAAGTSGDICGRSLCTKNCADATECTEFGANACCAPLSGSGNVCYPEDLCSAK